MNTILKDHIWQLWNVCTNSAYAEGALEATTNGMLLTTPSYHITTRSEQKEGGVYLRHDTLHNTSDETLTFSTLRSRFVFDGGEYEVYTQYNGWQNESQGQWHTLATEITARCESVRSSSGATPFLALWNQQTNRGIAFHLLTDSSWSISAKRIYAPNENSYVGVELGIDAPNVNLNVGAGEHFDLPEIIYYEFFNRLDFDCWKLHRYCHARMPRRRLPVIFNTWLYQFDHITFENVAKQIPTAARLGVEYFVIDAGWFGKDSSWGANIGDWEENPNFGFRGRMLEIAEMVRSHGMKFGFWLEVERAVTNSDAAQKYPQYFIPYNGNCFLDFANPEARAHIFDVLSKLVDHYGVSFIKFDFNADLCFDHTAQAFTEYFKGYRTFIKLVRKAYPDLYISNCASGGIRMVLKNCEDFESFWYSDNQSPYHGMRIFKDSILRLPPQVLERWTTIATNPNNSIPSFRQTAPYHILATGDAVWGHKTEVTESWLKGFLSSGPLSFSCDLEALEEPVKEMLTAHIAQFKQERSFWLTAESRILADTPSILILQHNNPAFDTCIVQIFIHKIKQFGLSVYPVLDPNRQYSLSPQTNLLSLQGFDATADSILGKTLMEQGIRVNPIGNYSMKEIRFTAKN